MTTNSNVPNNRNIDIGRRLSTETKASTKTTELYAYVAAVLAVIITAVVIGDNGDAAGGDSFGGSEAMRYITYLTIGYMIARGLAKAGSRDYYDTDNDNNGHAGR